MEVLYSLIGIGIERIDRLVKDEMFTNTLNFILINDDDDICSMAESILNRYYNDILPKVQYNVKCLIFESMLMERILLVASYPNLTQLKIYNFNHDFVSHYFIDESPFGDILKQQITDLTLISNEIRCGPLIDYTTNVYARILNFFKNLKHLAVVKTSIGFCPNLSFESLPSSTFSSSILTKLYITVHNFDDCLCLLDGHLKQLSTFNVSIFNVENHPSIVHNSDDLPNMKCFSLKIRYLRDIYDSEIVPLIRRMCNLEKLTLYLCIRNRNKYVDGIQLQNDILIYLEQLRTFVFYISSEIYSEHHGSTLLSDDIKRTFTDVKYGQVACFIDHCISRLNIYHIFSIPFAFDSLEHLRNNLPNIIFNNVTSLSIIGSIPFKYEYFLRLAKTFPFLKSLHFAHIVPDTLDDSDESKSNNNELYSAVEYPYLRSLDLLDAYIDYSEQFLNESKTRLPNLIELNIDYDALQTLTENFRRDATRLNCINIKRLMHHQVYGDNEIIVKPKDYYLYFPHL